MVGEYSGCRYKGCSATTGALLAAAATVGREGGRRGNGWSGWRTRADSERE